MQEFWKPYEMKKKQIGYENFEPFMYECDDNQMDPVTRC